MSGIRQSELLKRRSRGRGVLNCEGGRKTRGENATAIGDIHATSKKMESLFRDMLQQRKEVSLYK